MRLDRRSNEQESPTLARPRRTAGRTAPGARQAPAADVGVESHAPFVESAQGVFGNRAVGAALRGKIVEGPEALLHTVIALGSAGIYVANEANGALPNSVLVRLLAGRPVGDAGDPFAGTPSMLGEGAASADALGFSEVPGGELGAAPPADGAAGPAASSADVLSRRAGAGSGMSAGQRVDRARGTTGAPIPDGVRQDLEARFGASFAGVRVHTDGAAQAAADAVQARAYTVGQDIWFGAGQWAPQTPGGLELLAHELTHVLQNRRGDARGGGGEVIDGVAVSSPGDAREREADATAAAIVRDGPVGAADGPGRAPEAGLRDVPGPGGASGAGEALQRSPKPEPTDPVTRKLPDGTTVQVYDDGEGGHYIMSPEGERLATDANGTPTEDALQKMSNKARAKGESKPKPEKPEAKDPGKPDAGTTKGDKKGAGAGKDANGAKVGADGGGGSDGTAAGSGPERMDTLTGGPLEKYANERAWHDTWKAGGGQTGSLNTVGAGDKALLIGDALLSGGAEGFVNGAQAMLIDAVLNKATKNIPYAAGFIAIAQIAYDPKKWWEETVVQGIGGKVGEGWDKLTSGESDWIDRFEGVINILEGLNNIIGLASTVCMIVAAAGFILSFICPALIPFVALAAKWGLLLGEINTIVGLGINLLRGICVVARAVQIAVSDADPATQAKRAEKLKAMMASWSEDFTKRKAAKLQEKYQTKRNAKSGDAGPDATPAKGGGAKGDGSSAETQKKSWKERAKAIASDVTGVGEIKKGVTKTFIGEKGGPSTLKSTMDLTKASWGNGSREQRWNKMLAVDGDIATQNTKDRYERHLEKRRESVRTRKMAKLEKSNPVLAEKLKKNREAMEANREGQGLVKDDGRSAFGDRDTSPDAIRTKATDPDFWDPKNSAQRRSVRRKLEKSSDPKDREMARQMKQAERRLHEFETGRKPQPGAEDDAVVRVTTESGLRQRDKNGNPRLTAGKRGTQGVTKLKDSRGAKSGEEMADRLGFEQSYTKETRDGKNGKGNTYEHTDRTGKKTSEQDHFVAVIYTPGANLKRSDLKEMTQLIQKHGNQDGLFGGKRTTIEKNIKKAMNTPKAPTKPDGTIDEAAVRERPDLYGSMEIQRMKQELENRLGANQQKTGDGRTLTEGGHKEKEQSHRESMDRILQQTEGKSENSRKKRQRRANRAYGDQRKGDSYTEYYDTQLAPGKTNPLETGSAKKLSEYDELPVVRRMDWEQEAGKGTATGGQGGGGSSGKVASSVKGLKDRIAEEFSATPWADFKKSARDGLSDTAQGFRRGNLRNNLSSAQDLPANGYGHDGTGGYGGAGVGPVQQMINGSTSSFEAPEREGRGKKAATSFLRFGNDKAPDGPSGLAGTDAGRWISEQTGSLTSVAAVNPDGSPRLDADGKPGQVGLWDRAKSGMTGGLIGKDAAGQDNHSTRTSAFVQAEQKELQERLKKFDEEHISASDALTAPPVEQESVIDTASNTWAAYDAEIEQLREQARINEELKAEAAKSAEGLKGEKKVADGNKSTIGNQKSEISTKKENQSKARSKIGEQGKMGGELSGSSGKALGAVVGFVSGFMEMCGMIPSRLSSSGSTASAGASKIKDGVTQSNESGKQAGEKTAQDNATVDAQKSTTVTAEQDTCSAETELVSIGAAIDTEITNTETGKNELAAAGGSINDTIRTLEAKKAEESARHATAVGTLSGWADEHLATRTGQKSAGDATLADLEKSTEELKKKAGDEEGRDGGTPDGSVAGVGGPISFSALGPLPSDAPTSLDPSLLQGGHSLPSAVRGRMEGAFGQSFDDVRIHVGGGAAEANASFNARAFAFGTHVLFGEGQYRPGTPDGDHLLAHELAHVANGRGGPRQVAKDPLQPTSRNAPEEREADRMADRATGRAGSGPSWEATGNLRGSPPVRSRTTPPNTSVVEDQATYQGRRRAADNALRTQRTRVARGGPLLDANGNITDFRYWFAKVYSFVTLHELAFTDRRAYYYPSYIMASVAYFEQIYADNYAAFDRGGNVEEHWRAAFETGVRQKQYQDQLADMMLHPTDPDAAAGPAMAYLTQSVLGAVTALTASMKAHIRYDLPRAEAWVFNTYYAGMPGVTLADFQPDFMAMSGVFDVAGEQMNGEMAERLGLPVNLIPRMIQDGSMATLFDADMATERADTWQRAEDLVVRGEAGSGPYILDREGAISGDVTRTDNLGPISRISPGLRPSMDSSSPMLDDDDSRALVARSDPAALARLSATEKARRLRGLVRGVTLDDDEVTIQAILDATVRAGDTVVVVGAANAWDMLQAVDGAEYRTLRSFLVARYYGATEQETAFANIRRCLDGATSEWEEEMVADILMARATGDGRAIIERLGRQYGDGAASAEAAYRAGLNKLEWQLDGADEERITRQYGPSGSFW